MVFCAISKWSDSAAVDAAFMGISTAFMALMYIGLLIYAPFFVLPEERAKIVDSWGVTKDHRGNLMYNLVRDWTIAAPEKKPSVLARVGIWLKSALVSPTHTCFKKVYDSIFTRAGNNSKIATPGAGASERSRLLTVKKTAKAKPGKGVTLLSQPADPGAEPAVAGELELVDQP